MGIRQLLKEGINKDENIELQDVVDILEELTESQLALVAEDILDQYFFLDDELEIVSDVLSPDYVLGDDEVLVQDYDDEPDEDDLEEGFQKQSKATRMKDRRESKKNRKKAKVKKDLKARGKKHCSDNQRVQKIGQGVYKCVPKDAASKKRGKRMKKFKKLYQHG